LLMCVAAVKANAAVEALHRDGYPHAIVIGEVIDKQNHALIIE